MSSRHDLRLVNLMPDTESVMVSLAARLADMAGVRLKLALRRREGTLGLGALGASTGLPTSLARERRRLTACVLQRRNEKCAAAARIRSLPTRHSATNACIHYSTPNQVAEGTHHSGSRGKWGWAIRRWHVRVRSRPLGSGGRGWRCHSGVGRHVAVEDGPGAHQGRDRRFFWHRQSRGRR